MSTYQEDAIGLSHAFVVQNNLEATTGTKSGKELRCAQNHFFAPQAALSRFRRQSHLSFS
jgi:hypothetical protein